MQSFGTNVADSLFSVVGYDNLDIFMRLAANYNVLGDFLNKLSDEKRKDILHRFIADIEKDESTALERAMDIADSFSGLTTPELKELV